MKLIDTFGASGHYSESLRVAVSTARGRLVLAHRVQAEPGQGHQQLTRRRHGVLIMSYLSGYKFIVTSALKHSVILVTLTNTREYIQIRRITSVKKVEYVSINPVINPMFLGTMPCGYHSCHWLQVQM